MKILMLTTNASLMDGINRHILSVAGALNRREDCEVAVCTVMPDGDLNEALKHVGVKAYALGFPNGHALGVIGAFAKVINDFEPDIIHSHVMAIMERIYLSYCGRGIRFMETIHGISDAKGHVTLRDRLETLICKLSPIKVRARCYVSNGVRETLQQTMESASINAVSYNPVEFDVMPHKTYRLHDELSLSHATPIIGTACRISYVKNPKAFTEVMCRVLSEVPLAHAVVIGDGDKLVIAECKQIAESYGVIGRFHWMGYRTDAPELVSGLSCFVMTSRSEGMPTSLLECFASGTPVAMLRGEGGLKDIVSLSAQQKPIVLHSAPDDSEDLAHKIVQLFDNHTMAAELVHNAFEVGAATFSLKAVAEQLYGIYQRILR